MSPCFSTIFLFPPPSLETPPPPSLAGIPPPFSCPLFPPRRARSRHPLALSRCLDLVPPPSSALSPSFAPPPPLPSAVVQSLSFARSSPSCLLSLIFLAAFHFHLSSSCCRPNVVVDWETEKKLFCWYSGFNRFLLIRGVVPWLGNDLKKAKGFAALQNTHARFPRYTDARIDSDTTHTRTHFVPSSCIGVRFVRKGVDHRTRLSTREKERRHTLSLHLGGVPFTFSGCQGFRNIFPVARSSSVAATCTPGGRSTAGRPARERDHTGNNRLPGPRH